MNQTYDDIAELYGVQICHACNRVNHRSGGVTDVVLGGQIHWKPRHMTRAGLRNYLKWLAIVVDSKLLVLPPDERLYWQNVWVYRTSAKLGIHIPKRLSYTDRAKVAATYRGPDKTIQRWMRSRGL